MIEIWEQLNICEIERPYGDSGYRALPFNSRHHHHNPKLEDRFPKAPEDSKNVDCARGLTVAGRLNQEKLFLSNSGTTIGPVLERKIIK